MLAKIASPAPARYESLARSKPDPSLPLRLLRYTRGVWEQLRAQGARGLPLVVPVVVCHARRPWTTNRALRDLYDARVVVETAAVRRLAAGGSIPAEALRAHRELLAVDPGTGAFARLDAEFHEPRAHGTFEQGRRRTCGGQQLVAAVAARCFEDRGRQHQGILDAVVSGDADAAAARTVTHIEGALDRLLTATPDSPEPLIERT